MVPMRNLKFKFEEGEKVLCYEPDPTKARVLYDSKVLEVSVNRDKKGRKSVEYLIHFQGWNSSWDRYVSEDHILKHTEENWKLQKELAEKAQLRPTAYLYRRDLKGTKGNELYRGINKVEDRTSHHGLASTSSRDSSPNTHSSHSTVSDKDASCRGKDNTSHRRKRERSVMEDEQFSNDCADNVDSDLEFGIKNEIESVASEEVHSDEDDDDDDLTHIRTGGTGDQDSDFVDNNNTDNSDSSIEEEASDDDPDDVSYSEEGPHGYIEEENFPLEFTEVMKDLLDLDNEFIKNGNKLVSLPANPNVVTILESYVKEYAINQICGTPENLRRKHRRHHNHHSGPLDIERINRCINICKEVADGVRIYFDFTLSGLLLYNEEKEQYEHIHRMNIKKEPDSRIPDAFENVGENVFHESSESYSCEPSTSHLNDLAYDDKYECSDSLKSDPRLLFNTDVEARDSLPLDSGVEKPVKSTDVCAANGSFYYLVVPKKEPSSPEGKLSSVISNPLKHTVLGTSSDLSSLDDMLRSRGCPPASLKFLLSQVLEWRLVPESLYKDGSLPPSVIYGAIHLARLFVKLPGLLHNTDMQARKLKLVLRHLQMILRYLEQNKSWFGEEFYFDNPGQKIEC